MGNYEGGAEAIGVETKKMHHREDVKGESSGG